MIAEGPRVIAYAEALRRTVTDECIVAEIGTGTGFFATYCAMLGARRVYAIDPSDAIVVAREVAHENGVADRIVFLKDVSTRVELPEPADVIVSDLRGVLPLHDRHLESIVDARNRHLATDGVLIPARDILYAALVEAADLYRGNVEPWSTNGLPVKLDSARRRNVMTWSRARVLPGQLLTRPRSWAELDYRTLIDSHVRGSCAWTFERTGTAHGIAIWFETRLVDDVGFSNAPDEPECVYESAFFPLESPVEVRQGDRAELEIRADSVGGNYVWSWRTHIMDEAGTTRARFEQSTLLAMPFGADALKWRAHDHVPALDEYGQIDRFILSRIDGRSSISAIAREVLERFPDSFDAWEDALTEVGELSERYSASSGEDDSIPKKAGQRQDLEPMDSG